jgi:hypothetical protein
MSLTPRKAIELAKDLCGRSAQEIDKALSAQHLDATERVSVKLEIQAQAGQRRIEAALGTDTAEYSLNRQPANETQRLLVRAGFRLGQRYGATDVDHMLQESGFDATQRIACRMELAELRMTAAAEATASWRTLQASAEKRPTLLMDERGQPRTLRSYPE